MYLFVYDEVMLKEVQEKMKLPMTFISFGMIDGFKMYDYKKRLAVVPFDFVRRTRGNTGIYGAIFKLEEPYFYLRIIDAYYGCSKTRILENHKFDRTHRLTLNTYPFYIEKIEELISGDFCTFKPIKCEAWLANQNDETLIRRIARNRHKVNNGCKLDFINDLIKGSVV